MIRKRRDVDIGKAKYGGFMTCRASPSHRQFQLRFYMKIFVLILLVIDLILLYSIPDIAVRPLLVARCCTNYLI